MYTCGELTHSPDGGDLGGPARQWQALGLQKRETARNGRLLTRQFLARLTSAAMNGRLSDLRNQGGSRALSKSAATDGRLVIFAIRDDCMPS